jgi:hypothetical protein
LKQSVITLIEALPDDALMEVVDFLEFQQYKRRKRAVADTPYRPVALGGLLSGVTITDGDIADVRREMWGNLGNRGR